MIRGNRLITKKGGKGGCFRLGGQYYRLLDSHVTQPLLCMTRYLSAG